MHLLAQRGDIEAGGQQIRRGFPGCESGIEGGLELLFFAEHERVVELRLPVVRRQFRCSAVLGFGSRKVVISISDRAEHEMGGCSKCCPWLESDRAVSRRFRLIEAFLSAVEGREFDERRGVFGREERHSLESRLRAAQVLQIGRRFRALRAVALQQVLIDAEFVFAGGQQERGRQFNGVRLFQIAIVGSERLPVFLLFLERHRFREERECLLHRWRWGRLRGCCFAAHRGRQRGLCRDGKRQRQTDRQTQRKTRQQTRQAKQSRRTR